VNILIVDSDLHSVKLTSFLLEDAGYTVMRVADDRLLLQTIQQVSPDLVLMDALMPNLSGVDICRQLRRVSDVPIIFVSSRAQLQDRVEGLQVGGDDYLAKPYEPAELLARVMAVLRRRQHGASLGLPRLSRGRILLDPIEHTVTLDQTYQAKLTPLEFRLLYYIMQNAGKIVSADHILEKVWGYHHSKDYNLVAVYIRRLRAKIETDARFPRHIYTIRNVGYRFES
jgi:DNA-binding response OmpR family regulator